MSEPVVEAGADAQLTRPPHERRGELVGDRLVHVDPLDAHADLAGADEAGTDSPLGCYLDVHVLGDVHRVLAAELERGRDQERPGLCRDDPPGARGPGEAHMVHVLDHGRTISSRRRRPPGAARREGPPPP